LAPVKALILTILDPTPKKFSGEVSWVEVDLDPLRTSTISQRRNSRES
jgi:hypothetical protein